MLPSGSGLSPKAIGWALISQAVWLPLLAIDLHDRWVARQREITPPGRALPASPLARATPLSINDLLGAARPVQQLASQANQAVSGAFDSAVRGAGSGVGLLLSSAGSSASSLLERPFTVSLETHSSDGASRASVSQPVSAAPANTLLGRAFTRAQLLGGSIALSDLQEGPMAPLALAERAVQRSSGDPLSPLPSLWREPMRQALLRLPGAPLQFSPARLVHVPSSSVNQTVEVPLALQSDGSVDILESHGNAAVLREIESWSRQQRLPATGTLVPAIVHLHPLSGTAAPAPASRLEAASGRSASAGSVSRTSGGSVESRARAASAKAAPSGATAPTGSAAAASRGSVQATGTAASLQGVSLRREAPAQAADGGTAPASLRSEASAPPAESAAIPEPILTESPAASVAAAPIEAPAPAAAPADAPAAPVSAAP